jgi:hypothetical protein
MGVVVRDAVGLTENFDQLSSKRLRSMGTWRRIL